MPAQLALDREYLGTPRVSEEEIRRAWERAEREFRQAARETQTVKYLSNATNEETEDSAQTWFESASLNLEILLSDLGALLRSVDYNEEFSKPTEYAINTAWSLLVEANQIRGSLPLGTIYPDGTGGIRIEWIREGIELRSIIPADDQGRGYIYHETGNQYEADYSVSGNNLSYWLEWFNNNERGAR